MAKHEKNVPEEKPEEELSYAEILRRREDEDRYLAEQRMQSGPTTGCLGMSASFLIGACCVVFLIVGLGFAGCGNAGQRASGTDRRTAGNFSVSRAPGDFQLR